MGQEGVYETQSVHLSDQLVDVGLAVAMVASLDVVPELACSPATSWVGKFEGPEEVAGLFEVSTSLRPIQTQHSPA